MSDDVKGSFIRWQGITIQQLSFVNNLVIGLSAGILAFQFSVAFNEDTVFDCTSKWLFSFSIGLIFISVILGCAAAWNRLMDFRNTEKIVRKREIEDLNEIEILRKKTRCLGIWTWRLLKLQLLFFGLGVMLITTQVILRVIV